MFNKAFCRKFHVEFKYDISFSLGVNKTHTILLKFTLNEIISNSQINNIHFSTILK